MNNYGRYRTSAEMLEERAALLEDAETLSKLLKKEGRGMSKSEQLEFDRLMARVSGVNEEIKENQEVKDRKAAEADARYHGTKPGGQMHAKSAAIRSIIQDGVTSITESTIHGALKRAVTSTSASATIQDPNVTGEVIYQPLQNGPLGKLGIDIRKDIPQNASIAKVTDYMGLNPHAETTEITAGNMVVSPDVVNFTNFAGRIDMAGNVTRDSVMDWGEMVNNGFNISLENTVTKQVLAGPGGTEITGIDTHAGVQTVDAGSTTLTWDMILTASQKVMAQNVDPEKIAIIMHPATWLQLQSLKDTTGQQITKPSGLDGVPIVVHTAVATDYGVGSDETRVYVGDFSTCKLMVGGKYEITSEKSKADHDMVQFIMIYRADMLIFHPERLVRIENVAIA